MVSKLEDRIFVNILGFANNISGSWIVQKYSVWPLSVAVVSAKVSGRCGDVYIQNS